MSESEDTDIIHAPTSIVRAPTDITSVNSSLAKPTMPNQDSLAKVTFYKLDLDTILDGLIPDPLPESGGQDNAIHHLNIIIFGKPNTGKTTLAESIAQALARRYGPRNVKALRATRDLPGLFQNIDRLFGRFRKPPKAILLFADDMTKALKKLSGSVEVMNSSGQSEKMRRIDYWLDKWYDIRGELFKRGMRQGIVVMVAGLHRFYGGDIDLRADADLLLVRSTGTPGTFDANKVERMLGPVVYYAMRQHEVDALRDRKELAWTAFVAKTGSGVFRVPRPSVSTKWLMRNVGSPESSQELAVDIDEPKRGSTVDKVEPKKKSAELVEPKNRSALEERPSVRLKQHPQPRPHRTKRRRRVAIIIAAVATLAVAFLAWKYVLPFLR